MKKYPILSVAFALFFLASIVVMAYWYRYHKRQVVYTKSTNSSIDSTVFKNLKKHAFLLRKFNAAHKFNSSVCFLIDIQIVSGKNRFFVYDLTGDSIKIAGLVSHGSGNKAFAKKPHFSNTIGSGFSSKGKYTVGYRYNGRFGNAYKLIGLDTSNNNAFERNVVLHAYDCVPDKEPYPFPICNSLGCPMVSYSFLKKLEIEINKSKKPLLLWMF